METIQEIQSLIQNLSTDDCKLIQASDDFGYCLQDIKVLIKKRCEHCASELKAHIHEAKSVMDGQVVVWNGGHFSVVTYKAMQDFLENPSLCNINRLIAQQALRSMRNCDDYKNDDFLFTFLTELVLTADYVTFKNQV